MAKLMHTFRRALRFMTDPRRKDVEALGLGKYWVVRGIRQCNSWLGYGPQISYGSHKLWGLEEIFFLVYMAIFGFHAESRGCNIKPYLQAETAIELLDHDCKPVNLNVVCRLSQQCLVSARFRGTPGAPCRHGMWGRFQWWIPQNA